MRTLTLITKDLDSCSLDEHAGLQKEKLERIAYLNRMYSAKQRDEWTRELLARLEEKFLNEPLTESVRIRIQDEILQYYTEQLSIGALWTHGEMLDMVLLSTASITMNGGEPV